MSEDSPYFVELRMLFGTTKDGIASTTRQVDKAAEDFPIKPDGAAGRTITNQALEYEVESRYKFHNEEIYEAIRANFTWTEEDETFMRKWLYDKEETLRIIGAWLGEAFIREHDE